jgi:hypothetical protein
MVSLESLQEGDGLRRVPKNSVVLSRFLSQECGSWQTSMTDGHLLKRHRGSSPFLPDSTL